MKTYPNCKINLGLHVMSRRADGYHNLETVFVPVPQLTDVLEIEPSQEFSFCCEGLDDCGPADNIVVRTYLRMRELYGVGPVSIRLVKRIPTGAGLGGGSSDAAFAARMLNVMFGLELDDGSLMQLLAPIGADCPFFVLNRPCLATGIGDILEPMKPDLDGLAIIIVKPAVSVPTRLAYSRIVPRDKSGLAAVGFDLRCLPETPVEQWRQLVVNDFEQSVFPDKPEIAAVKQRLYDMGAVYAAMSGSGSAVFGLFQHKNAPSAGQLKASFPDCFTAGER